MEIKKGARGNEVIDVQQRLSALGFDLGPTVVDGSYAEKTEAAVKAFQEQRNLPITGVVDEATWKELVNATYKLGARALYLRAPFFHGDDVRQLQDWLHILGFYTGTIDGIFGPILDQAVREFQRNVELPSDGIVGPTTLQALDNLHSIFKKREVHFLPGLASPFPSSSTVSIIKEKRVAIGCPALNKRAWLSKSKVILLCVDLAFRLSNLLELLGAEVEIFKTGAKKEFKSEVAIIFENSDSESSNTLIVKFPDGHGLSEKLADFIEEELRNFFESETLSVKIVIARGLTASVSSSQIPQVYIGVPNLPFFEIGDAFEKDVLKQKIAGAIFDGLKKFLETPLAS